MARGPVVESCQDACDARAGCGDACTSLTPTPDGDAAGIPDASDNCPPTSNADQAELDDDGAGDVCDAADATIATARIMVRPGPANASKGKITIDGTFVAPAPSGGFEATASITAAVARADGTTRSATWPSALCTSRNATQVTCTSDDRSAKATFRVKPRRRVDVQGDAHPARDAGVAEPDHDALDPARRRRRAASARAMRCTLR